MVYLLGKPVKPTVCSDPHLSWVTVKEIRTNQLSWLGVGLIISMSMVQFAAGAIWSVLGQENVFHIASVNPAEKWVPSLNKAVPRACALYMLPAALEYPPGD